MKQENIKKLYAIHAKIYDLTRPFFLLGRKKALWNIDIKNNQRIIDYWCWTGMNYKELIKRHPGMDYIWIDISEDMLAEARKKYKKWNFELWDISTYKKTSDRAICTYVLSMIDNYEDIIINIKENLNLNWTFVVLDFYPFTWFLHKFFPLLKYLYISWVNPEKPIIATLKKHFPQVETEISQHWHHFICICKK